MSTAAVIIVIVLAVAALALLALSARAARERRLGQRRGAHREAAEAEERARVARHPTA